MNIENILIKIGNNIKKYRQAKKITIDELSIKTKIRKNYIKKIESGKAFRLMPHHLFKIAKVLQTPIYIFFE